MRSRRRLAAAVAGSAKEAWHQSHVGPDMLAAAFLFARWLPQGGRVTSRFVRNVHNGPDRSFADFPKGGCASA
jgi:hypothetical protein